MGNLVNLIMSGSVEPSSQNQAENVGVVALVYMSFDEDQAKEKLTKLQNEHPDTFYMLYQMPMDTDLTEFDHYPSIEISKEDLLDTRNSHAGYPARPLADLILAEAVPHNPGPWEDHSKTAAHCASKIAEYAGMDVDKAYALGLLHDIGRRFGKRHLGHVSDGYTYMMKLGYPDVAQICLTHSFNEQDIHAYVGNFDTSEEETKLIQDKLNEVVFDDYDRLILLVDAISGAEGVMDIVDRMNDVKSRYGHYDQAKWDTNIALKEYFEKKMGRDLYEAVEKETFKP